MTAMSMIETCAIVNFWLFVDKFKLEFKVINKDNVAADKLKVSEMQNMNSSIKTDILQKQVNLTDD